MYSRKIVERIKEKLYKNNKKIQEKLKEINQNMKYEQRTYEKRIEANHMTKSEEVLNKRIKRT